MPRGRLVHDGRPTKGTYLLLQSKSNNVLRDLHLCSTSSDNNALVLVDQVGL